MYARRRGREGERGRRVIKSVIKREDRAGKGEASGDKSDRSKGQLDSVGETVRCVREPIYAPRPLRILSFVTIRDRRIP